MRPDTKQPTERHRVNAVQATFAVCSWTAYKPPVMTSCIIEARCRSFTLGPCWIEVPGVRRAPDAIHRSYVWNFTPSLS
jgi:hypothetical protein